MLKKIFKYITQIFRKDYKIYKYGDELYKQGLYSEAISEYQKAYSGDSTNSYYYYAVGIAYYGLKNYEQALYYLLEAVAHTKNNKDDEYIYNIMIDIYTDWGKPDACIEIYDILLSTCKEGSEKYRYYQQQKADYIENIEKIEAEKKILYQKELAKIEELFQKSSNLRNEKQYQQALNIIEEAYRIADKQGIKIPKFDKLKSQINKQIEKYNKVQNLYDLAVKSFGWKDYRCALLNIKAAISFEPDNNKYKNFLAKIEKEIEEISKDVKDLYNDFIERKKAGDYKSALYFLNKAITTARKKKLDTTELSNLKNELIKYMDNLGKAESLYKCAINSFTEKDYEKAINSLKNAILLIPDNKEYQKKLYDIKSEYKKVLNEAEKFYLNAKNLLDVNEFDNAKTQVNSALELLKERKYIKLHDDIDQKQQKFLNEQKAEKIYTEALTLYNSSNSDYEQIFDLLDRAINLSPKKVYKDLRGKIKHDRDVIVAENLYEDSKSCFDNKDFNKALSLIKEAIKLSPSNRIYIDLKQKIDWEQKEYEKRQNAEEYYTSAIEYYNEGEFSDAIECLENALELQPNNDTYKTLLERARECKIDIITCTSEALMTLDFIDEETAESIIQARNDGVMWYDYQAFAQQFNIMPHLYPDVEAKIIFPLKQANKYGRRLDW